jgi:hypothetical protein
LDASQNGQGWTPLFCLVGNNAFCALDTALAVRLRNAMREDEVAVLTIAGKVHEVLRDYVETMTPA